MISMKSMKIVVNMIYKKNKGEKTMKKIVRFLIDCSLVAIIFMSAQRAMNLPFSWAGIGYAVLFGIALGIFTQIRINAAHKQGIQHGIEEQKINKQIYEMCTKGEDKFSITIPNFLEKKYEIYFKTKRLFLANDSKEFVCYAISEICTIDRYTYEVTFTKNNN